MTRKRIDKNEIVNIAIGLADKKGFYNISLKEIADELNIKTPSLYNHINGLNGLYDLLAQEGLKRLLSTMADAVIGLSGKEALLSLGNAYVKFACLSPGLYIATQQAAFHISETAKDLSNEIVEFIVKIISKCNLPKEAEIHIVRTLRSYLHGFALLKSQDAFKIPVDIDKSFEIGFESIISGLGIN